MENVGLNFNKRYYKGIEEILLSDDPADKIAITRHFEQRNNLLLNLSITNTCNQERLKFDNLLSVRMKVGNTGLLIGTGNSHQTGNKSEFKLGMSFDYTSGLPYIPASSIKGVLRSFFNGKKQQYTEYILNEVVGNNKEMPPNLLNNLDKNIFDGIDFFDEGSKQLGIYKRDIFFDAYPFVIGGTSQRLFSKDFITPHKEALKNPIPIEFMKIRAGVVFQFNFKLFDYSCKSYTVTAEQKKQLFAHFLSLGIGAKTNVGYGQLTTV